MAVISVLNTSMAKCGKRGISKDVSREDLERTLMDILTFDMDLSEAIEIVENASINDLICMIKRYS